MLEVGSLVGDRFRIERILGKGGMGVVAVATHLQLEQRVAIKVLHEPMSADTAVVARFLREAQASARLRSDHVCRVFDVGRLDDGAPYIVMELLDGSDLSQVIADGVLPVATAVDYVLQACIAIAEAHALGIVHRDLKPANLFLTRRLDGSPLIKVLDFGIAKAPAAGDFKITSTSMVMGSPGYMSPEQLRSTHDTDARSDIWALGVILYELVTGRLPFHGDSITELAVKVTVDPPDPLDIDAPGFAAVVYRCLEKSLDARYPSVAALAADLAPLGGDLAGKSAILIAQLGGSAGAPGPARGAAATRPATAPPPAPGAPGPARGVPAAAPPPAPAAPGPATPGPVSGHATTLQTAAAQSSGSRIPARDRSRAGLYAGGAALVVAAAAAALLLVRSSRAPAPPPPRPVAVVTADAGAGAVPEALGPDAAAVAVTADAAAGDAGAASPNQAALRDKLRELAAARDWAAVLEIADLDRGDPDVAAMVGDARRQYVGQQARAIDALVKQGNCARAREIATAAHQVVADDTTLEPRARACKPRTTTPEVPPTIALATLALDHGELPRALEIADKLLAMVPGDLAAARIAALAACGLNDADRAARYSDRLHGHDRSEVRAQCEAHHIDVGGSSSSSGSPGASSSGSGSSEGASESIGEVSEAQDALRSGQWARALSLAQAALQRAPRSTLALRTAVVAACHLHDEATAHALIRRVPLRSQRTLRQQCADQGVLL